MEKKAKTSSKKFTAFLKKNVYYILMVMCVIAIGTMIIVAALQGKDKGGDVDVVTPPPKDNEVVLPDPEPEIPVSKGFEIGLPVSGATIGYVYDDSKLVFNGAGDLETHLGINYHAAAGTKVVAAAAGVVSKIYNDALVGYSVEILHKDGFVSVYKLLGDKLSVKTGQAVKVGDVLGEIALVDTSIDKKLGAHLHFELLKDGKLINPDNYMAGSIK